MSVLIQIEPTDIWTTVQGIKVRVWNGITQEGMQVFCFMAGVAVRAEDDAGELARVLDEAPVAGAEELLRGMR